MHGIPLHLAAQALPHIIVAVIALAASAAAYFLLRPDGVRNPAGNQQAEDFALSNLSSQGAYIPLLIGRRRIGAVICWVGDRASQNVRQSQRQGGSKGRSHSRKTIITNQVLFQESAWHCLCVGPAKALYRIWSEGKVIFDQKITPGDTPSGSVVTTEAGIFRIFWGEPTQPVNDFLGMPSRVGVDSRWPHVCYVVWIGKWLGSQPNWPQLEYELEVEPRVVESTLTDAAAVIPTTYVGVGYENANLGHAMGQILFESYPHGLGCPIADWDYNPAAGGGGPGPLRTFDCNAPSFLPGVYPIQCAPPGSAPSIPAGPYTIAFEPTFYVGPGIEEGANYLQIFINEFEPSGSIDQLRVFVEGPGAVEIDILTLRNLGVIYDGVDDFFTYVPPAGWVLEDYVGQYYLIYQFDSETPVLNLPVAGVWDLRFEATITYVSSPSFSTFTGRLKLTPSAVPSGTVYEFIERCDTEGLAGSVIAKDGEEAATVLGTILQDTGHLVPRVCDGRTGFEPVREVADADIVQTDEDQEVNEAFELEVVHAERFVDRAIFSFNDLDRNYRNTTITIDEDGQARELLNNKGRVLAMATVVDPEVAQIVAERRSQEELANGTRYTFQFARGFERLIPGKVLSIPTLDGAFRVLEVSIGDDTDKATVEAAFDNYGAPETSYEHTFVPTPTGPDPDPQPNLQEDFFEIPCQAGTPGLVLIAPLRIRADTNTQQNFVWLSADDITYDLEATQTVVQTGGLLTSALQESTPFLVEQGPTFDLAGPLSDFNAIVQDLSTNEVAWRNGSQQAIINGELFFVREVVALGGSSYRLDGLLRQRYDTLRVPHGIGDEVYLFRPQDVDEVSGNLIAPNVGLYVKQQPIAFNEQSLATINADFKLLEGKGLTPMRPAGLRVELPFFGVPAYNAGDDVVFSWEYRSCQYDNTGAGLQGAGVASGTSGIEGEFEVQVYDTGDVLQATYNTGQTLSFNYTNAQLQADLGGEVDFYVLVRNINGGWRSGPIRLDVEFV